MAGASGGPGAPRGRSREYFDVIKAIGECKSKIEEDVETLRISEGGRWKPSTRMLRLRLGIVLEFVGVVGG